MFIPRTKPSLLSANKMFDKLRTVEGRYIEIERMLTLPDIAQDGVKFRSLMKEYRAKEEIVTKYREYRALEGEMRDALEMMEDATLDSELRELAGEEYYAHKESLVSIEEELKLLLIPKDPNDERNVVVEIRQGTGGEEAALFAADIFRMYSMYAQKKGFSVHVTQSNETELGGYKEITFTVKGEGAFSRFKFESGTHRVQRIPETESNGRIQTSAVTVAVLPEVEAVEVEISPADIHFESCKSSGAGGQHINKTESAVRLTHKPTGIVIECDSERSQLQNKEQALAVLRAKLYDMKQREQTEKIARERKSQVGSGDRSEKIRTYNYPQSRVTDHRINKTIYSLDEFMNGDIDGIVTELIAQDTAERLRRENDGN